MLRELGRESERESCISLPLSLSLALLPLTEEFSFYQKLRDSLDQREKVYKSDTNLLIFFNNRSLLMSVDTILVCNMTLLTLSPVPRPSGEMQLEFPAQMPMESWTTMSPSPNGRNAVLRDSLHTTMMLSADLVLSVCHKSLEQLQVGI